MVDATVICPICQKILFATEMGVNAHLQSHVKKRELPRSQVMETRQGILKRKFVTREVRDGVRSLGA